VEDIESGVKLLVLPFSVGNWGVTLSSNTILVDLYTVGLLLLFVQTNWTEKFYFCMEKVTFLTLLDPCVSSLCTGYSFLTYECLKSI